MNIKNVLAATIAILDTVDHVTDTKIDDELLKLAIVVRDSPLLIAYIEEKLAKLPTPGETGPTDPFRACLRGRRDEPTDPTDRAEIGERLAGLGEIMKYLPMILELLKMLRDAGILTPKAA